MNTILTSDGTTWTWHRERTERVGVVEVAARGGCRWWAHLADPRHVVAWSVIDDDHAASPLAGVFGANWAAHADQGMIDPTKATDGALTPPTVGDGWARLVVVLGLRRWYPLPLDETSLLIDEALAWSDAGEPEMAGLVIRRAGPVVAALAEALLDGALPRAAAPAVSAAWRLAIDHLDEDDPDRDALLDFEDQLARRSRVDSAALDAAVTRWVLDASARDALVTALDGEAAAAMGGAVAAVLEPATRTDNASPLSYGEVDPLCVSPRIVAGQSGAGADVLLRHVDGGVVVEIALVEGVPTTGREARGLIAYLCHRDTGRVLARRRFEPTTHLGRLQARLPLAADTPVVAGVYEVGVARHLRSTPLGRRLARIDRIALTAWAVTRHAEVARLSGDSSWYQDVDVYRRGLLARARWARRTAGDLVDDAARSLVSEATAFLPSAEAEPQASIADPVAAPTLAEILAWHRWSATSPSDT